MTSNQKIQVGHEVRMWITGVVIPVVGIVAFLATNPSVQNWIKEQKAKRAFKKHS